jgi:hypothetical protein
VPRHLDDLIDGTQLASALAERLAQVLPEGFSISSDGHDLWLDTPDGVGTSACAGAVDYNARDLALYAGAATTVLSSIQDGVSEKAANGQHSGAISLSL